MACPPSRPFKLSFKLDGPLPFLAPGSECDMDMDLRAKLSCSLQTSDCSVYMHSDLTTWPGEDWYQF